MAGLGELLVKSSVITSDQLLHAASERHGEPLGRRLVRLGYVTEEAILGHLQRAYSFPIIDPRHVEPCSEALLLIPIEVARKHQVVPIAVDDSSVTVATSDPSDQAALNAIRFLSGRSVKIALAPSQSVQKAIEAHYGAERRTYAEVLSKLSGESPCVARDDPEVDLDQLRRATEEAPIVKLVNVLLTRAAETRASDIHIEPGERKLRVRYRIDGVLHDVLQPPREVSAGLISRIKIMASLDISERRLPQDGAIKAHIEPYGELNLRVSVMPTVHGEKVVLRVLQKSRMEVDTADLGFDPEGLRRFKHAIHQPHGMVLVTGPTGSGKTTTLYSAIFELNDASRNISTAEDPVEIKIDGISQLQVNDEIDLTFARALRAFLRQDPDVIMVGEIRDFETAEIAVKAALTGHLVLSTLHTNDAPSAITRCLDMGLEPFLIASSLNLVVAQRLARRVCPHCCRPQEIPRSALAEVGFAPEEMESLTLVEGAGCEECAGTGYLGRVALFELMPMSTRLRTLVLNRVSADEIAKQAIAEGMKTLRESGLARLRERLTTLQEVLRVTTTVQE